jgi:hypothetical protein
MRTHDAARLRAHCNRLTVQRSHISPMAFLTTGSLLKAAASASDKAATPISALPKAPNAAESAVQPKLRLQKPTQRDAKP